MGDVMAALVAAITSVVVTVISLEVAGRQRRHEAHLEHREEINVRYLNPLRRQVAEMSSRLVQILYSIEADTERRRLLGIIGDPDELLGESAAWFAGEGYFLASTAYLTASLFAWIERVRRDHPFLRLTGIDDTALTELLVKVQFAFVRDLGIYYHLQPSIGENMWYGDDGRLRTYREFCSLLTDPEHLVWFRRIFLYYIETARGEKLDRIQEAIEAIHDLARHLDRYVAGSGSLAGPLAAEATRPSPAPR
ncbi:MAG TPA: hypothetical protein VFB06_35545 [Streptosporangiaceae bacterium]|nr:hypothetical protein [Streptosporangiaceae bacterium]